MTFYDELIHNNNYVLVHHLICYIKSSILCLIKFPLGNLKFVRSDLSYNQVITSNIGPTLVIINWITNK